MDYGTLPYTGGGLAFGAIIVGQSELLGIAIGLVTLGTVLIRFGWRRGKAGDAL